MPASCANYFIYIHLCSAPADLRADTRDEMVADIRARAPEREGNADAVSGDEKRGLNAGV